ncbi:hypothetical protein L0337_44390, partial [candidate division KSB1 bacterium]|nr:hypothetical protein [candidate division KSB1 bacterium]
MGVRHQYRKFSANAVFFRLGVLAYNLCQGLMKRFPARHPVHASTPNVWRWSQKMPEKGNRA